MSARVHPSALIVGRNYSSVTRVRETLAHTYLGTYLRTELVGRPYDPDAVLYFKHPNGTEFSFTWAMGTEEFYEGPPHTTG
jgi:hypothetical protein